MTGTFLLLLLLHGVHGSKGELESDAQTKLQMDSGSHYFCILLRSFCQLLLELGNVAYELCDFVHVCINVLKDCTHLKSLNTAKLLRCVMLNNFKEYSSIVHCRYMGYLVYSCKRTSSLLPLLM